MSEEFPLSELAGLPTFYHPRVSPDGEKVALYWDGTGRNELFVVSVESAEMQQLSDGQVPRSARWHIHWGPNSERIFFHADDAGDEQNDICAIDFDGNVETLVSLDGQCSIQDVSAEYLLFSSDAGDQMNLYRCPLDGGEVEQLTTSDQPVLNALFSPDGDRIAYATNESENLENEDTYVADADGSNPQKLPIGEEGYETLPSAFSPDGRSLLVGDNTEDLSRCGRYDFDSESVTWYGTGKYDEIPIAFRPEGNQNSASDEWSFVARRVREAGAVPVVYDGLGEVRELDLPEGVGSLPLHAGAGVFAADGSLVVSHASTDTRKQLYRYNLDTDEREVLLEADYGDIDPDTFVAGEYVTYESGENVEIGALLYDSGERPSPAVIRVHGGPHAQSQKNFDAYTQLLVNRGYTVLLPNYRGSTGRGREFKNRIHGDWGGGEQEDIVAGGRWLAEKDWIDEDRIAVLGGSYGGYSAYMQLVKYPEFWTTGVARVGITDLPMLYEEMMPHFKSVLEEQLGDPEENAELWRDRSPITHVESMTKPVQMIHGVNDPRCPISQARGFRDALEERGWTEGEDGDFEYVELGSEGHGSTDIDQKIRSFRLLCEYLDRRL